MTMPPNGAWSERANIILQCVDGNIIISGMTICQVDNGTMFQRAFSLTNCGSRAGVMVGFEEWREPNPELCGSSLCSALTYPLDDNNQAAFRWTFFHALFFDSHQLVASPTNELNSSRALPF